MTRTDHLLWILAEECCEVAQRASKAARFGLDEVQPGQELTNALRIVGELADLMAVMEMIRDENPFVLSYENFDEMIAAKKTKVETFLAYSRKCGTLEN